MVIEGVLETLQRERERLTKELNRVVKMIKAAGRGAQAAVKEYGRRTARNQAGVKKAVATKKRAFSTAVRKKMAAAQRARRAKEASDRKAQKAPKARKRSAAKAASTEAAA